MLGYLTITITPLQWDALLALADRGAEDLDYCIGQDPESYDSDNLDLYNSITDLNPVWSDA